MGSLFLKLEAGVKAISIIYYIIRGGGFMNYQGLRYVPQIPKYLLWSYLLIEWAKFF